MGMALGMNGVGWESGKIGNVGVPLDSRSKKKNMEKNSLHYATTYSTKTQSQQIHSIGPSKLAKSLNENPNHIFIILE